MGYRCKPPSLLPRNDAALLDAYSNAVIDVTERVGPAVVPGRDRPESAERARARRARLRHRDLARRPGADQQPRGRIVADRSGCSDIEGIVTDARVLGVDPDTDLALLRADGARDLRYASLGNSKTCAAASWWSRSAIRSALNRR